MTEQNETTDQINQIKSEITGINELIGSINYRLMDIPLGDLISGSRKNDLSDMGKDLAATQDLLKATRKSLARVMRIGPSKPRKAKKADPSAATAKKKKGDTQAK